MIKRSKRSKNFTVVNNEIYADNHLSYEAMGLLTYLLSKPDNWQVNVKFLAKASDETAQRRGTNKIYDLLKELEENGYIVRQKNADGSVDCTVYDNPVKQTPVKENPVKENPVKEKPVKEKPVKGKPVKGKPVKGKPEQAFRETYKELKDNKELNSNKELKGKKANSPPKAQKSDYDLVIEKIFSLHGKIPQPQKITDGRKAAIRHCLKRYGLEMVFEMLDKAAQSPLTSQGWFGFDFMWKDTPRSPNFLKIVEGNYDHCFGSGNASPQGQRREKNISTYYDENWTSPHLEVTS